MNFQKCINELLKYWAQYKDDIDAGWIATYVTDFVNDDNKTIRGNSLLVIREILKEDLMNIGDIIGIGYNPDLLTKYEKVEFKPWNLSIEEAISRVEKKWDNSVIYPTPGDVCWLVPTQKGKEIGHRLLKEEKDQKNR